MTLTFSVLKYASKFIAFVYKYYENQKKKKIKNIDRQNPILLNFQKIMNIEIILLANHIINLLICL